MEAINIEVIVAGSLIGAAVIALLVGFHRIGWKLPRTREDFKKMGALAVLALSLLTIAGTILINILGQQNEDEKGKKLRGDYEGGKNTFNTNIGNLNEGIGQAEDDATQAGQEADAANAAAGVSVDAAGDHMGAANAHADDADDALARANRLSRERKENGQA